MFHVLVWLTVKEASDVGNVRDLLAEARRLSRQEPGCLHYEVYHSQADRQRFVLCEHWESEQAWQAHRQERAILEIYQPQILPLVDRQLHISERVE